MKSRELDRALDALIETVFDANDSKVLRQIEAIGRDPQAETEMLRGMIERTIQAFERFYEAKQEEELLTAEQVAARYAHSLDWVYHCPQLIKIRIKIGKCLRWRESDLRNLENSQGERRRGFRVVMRPLPEEPVNPSGKPKVWAV